ncbi:hypothetical protein FHS83_002825 [Rhizomicrobium palustre]|uniref:Uncharacterized protein n=1 Tax=Rhizomicrobium palustre TaxID=189966 RepID=A0A846N316_9PROT|nr:hypothetical protein [Rhizomicrobium palustre]NIK89507.1 hypothetical protein [Rhizomicrobium palustre]
MHRICTCRLRRRDYLVGIEVGILNAATAQPDNAPNSQHRRGETVRIGSSHSTRNTHLIERANDAAGNLSTISDEDRFEHDSGRAIPD